MTAVQTRVDLDALPHMPDLTELTELRRLLNEVTQPQPWTTENGIDWESCIVAADDEVVAEADHDVVNLIVAAVNALPALLDAAEALERVKALHYEADNDDRRTPVCEACHGKAGVHECGCWADEDRQPVCGHCNEGRKGASAPWPCLTIRTIDGEPKP